VFALLLVMPVGAAADNSMVVQPDGKIVLSGRTIFGIPTSVLTAPSSGSIPTAAWMADLVPTAGFRTIDQVMARFEDDEEGLPGA
jgi:hypothetical protein